ncbi:TRAP transporter large permease [Desulfococcaceae bacterium HSG7]|nr:TRAP transporter large permease [Desulfococcaceae bacterium HSG9]MDM8553546.1 TRAP transporter large permease [Desulfococcaceae bacterium HSG7]
MNEYVLALLLFGCAFGLLISGIPIWSGLAGISILFILIFSPHLMTTLPYVLHGSMDSFALLAIPLFILLSAPIAESDASRDLYETLHKWLHKIPGGLGIANMVGCGIFAALCGSSPATAAAIGGIGIPEMRRRGYSPALATGLIAHAGTFGILIPPSVTMILYGVATETSIGKCFIAGIVPGILLVLLSCLWVAIVFFYRRFRPAKPGAVYYIEEKAVEEKFSWPEKFASLIKVLPFVLIIIGIMGSLYGGWATPSEAGGLGAVMSLVFVMVIYKIFRPPQLKKIFIKALNESSMILMIMAAALLFSWVSSDLYATQALGELILKLPLGKWGIIFVINILLLILGCFIPPAAVILMVAPLLLPIIQGLGFDPIWFAVIMTVNLEIGLVTPPVGLNLYVVKNIAPDIPMSQVLLGVVPFILIDCLVIVCLCIWPELAVWLPNKMIG